MSVYVLMGSFLEEPAKDDVVVCVCGNFMYATLLSKKLNDKSLSMTQICDVLDKETHNVPAAISQMEYEKPDAKGAMKFYICSVPLVITEA